MRAGCKAARVRDPKAAVLGDTGLAHRNGNARTWWATLVDAASRAIDRGAALFFVVDAFEPVPHSLVAVSFHREITPTSRCLKETRRGTDKLQIKKACRQLKLHSSCVNIRA